MICVFAALYYRSKYHSAIKNPNLEARDEAMAQLEKIKKFMDLPEEEPSFLVISDPEAARNQQPFFAKAELNDIVFVFNNSRKAILYRPESNRIIETAYVSTANQQGEVQNAEAQKNVPSGDMAKVIFYNGTQETGLAAKVKDKVILEINELETAGQANADNSNYTKSLIVDLSESKWSTKAKEIADFLGAELVSKLPSGIEKPQADIAVIVGLDQQSVGN